MVFPPPIKVHAAPKLVNLVSKLNVRVLPTRRRLSQPDGPEGRLKRMRNIVTALVKNERIEVRYHSGDEARGYAERLISEAIRYGDLHKPTMDLAKFWIHDEAAVPKLFKVLVPRYKQWPSGLPYTRMLKAPTNIADYMNSTSLYAQHLFGVLELRGNPFPPLPGPFAKPHPGAIHNVLLEEARKEYFRSQTNIEKQAEQQTQAVPVPDEEDPLEQMTHNLLSESPTTESPESKK
ncbi:39S ribosomal protein L17, mitochondrial [Orchesella cincta]|uniref:Large ribosomal subunit protein bL17m n=1 Tax=Orchesella cincta TaxID=48709 RepID=A0A1D2NK58_ORCCI|nr:39S ribosomal protein L17, mitochondrial [Orchesella cincta]